MKFIEMMLRYGSFGALYCFSSERNSLSPSMKPILYLRLNKQASERGRDDDHLYFTHFRARRYDFDLF